MTREEFKLRMKSLKSYRELNPGKGYWDWKVEAFEDGGETPPEGFSEVQQALMDEYYDDQVKAARLGRPQSGAITPVFGASDLPVIGDAMAIYDASNALIEGDYTTAALAGLAMLPFVPNVAKKINKKGFHAKSTAQDAIDWKTLHIEELNNFAIASASKLEHDRLARFYDMYHQTGKMPEELPLDAAGSVTSTPIHLSIYHDFKNTALARAVPDLNNTKQLEGELLDTRYNLVDVDSFAKGTSGKFGGYYSKVYDQIVLPTGFKHKALPHEIRHKFDTSDRIWLDSELKDYLYKAYDKNFKLKGYATFETEGVTTNYDARATLLEKYSHQDSKDYFEVDVNSQNNIIESATDLEIIDAVSNANGYGKAYIEYLSVNNLLTPNAIRAFRNAMKYVPAVAGAAVITNNINNKQSN